uniref:Variant surface glycoprotein 1349 n=1 Tax=Trypanosoma brucei TaxID=5691 RepID=M4SYB3_9TRYP|nr:variant surface glycoprotein 1349 [Trypanosoma brucei]
MCYLLTSIFLVAYAAGLGQAAAATKPAANRDDCTDPCNCRHRAQELIRYLSGLLDKTAGRVEESAKAAENLTVAAALTSGKKKANFAILAGITHDNAVAGAKVLNQNSPIVRQYLKHITTMYSCYDAEVRAPQSGKTYTVTPVGGSNHYGTATYSAAHLTATVSEACTTIDQEEKSPITAATLTKGQGLREPKLGISLKSVCKNSESACSGATASDIITVTLSIDHTTAPVTTGWTQSAATEAIPLAGTIKLTGVDKDKLDENHTVISAAVTALTGVPEVDARDSYTGHPQFTNLEGRFLLGIPDDTEIAWMLPSKVDGKINKIFGESQTPFDKQVWKDAEKNGESLLSEKKTQTGNLKKLEENIHMGVALAVALGTSSPAVPKCDTSSEEVKGGRERKETKKQTNAKSTKQRNLAKMKKVVIFV